MKPLLPLLVCLLSLGGRASAVYWNWFIANPHQLAAAQPADADADANPPPPPPPPSTSDQLEEMAQVRVSALSSSSSSTSENDDDVDVDRRRFRPWNLRQTAKNAEASTATPTPSADSRPFADHAQMNSCNADRECQLGTYCDRHYGLCKPYRTEGQSCRRDSQCAVGYDCMFGRCMAVSKPGHKGARCNNDRDCLAGLCCARRHGEKVCKPKLKLGQNCFVPDGGLPYWLNEICPCEEGLVCGRYVSTQQPPVANANSSGDWFNLWTDSNRIRCLRPPDV